MAATNKRGVFSLEKVLERQSDNHWSKIPEAFRYVNSLSAPAGTDFGYFAGGNSPGTTTIDRIDYSNDTATAAVKGPLAEGRRNHGATTNSSFGYFGGGSPSISSVNRVDYANDTSTAAVKGPLTRTIPNLYKSSTGNADFGYFAGGYPSNSIIDRVDYSNDTATASLKGNLNRSQAGAAAAGNQSFGYFAGGANPGGSTAETSISRIDYSSDTSTASPKGNLTETRKNGVGSTGNASYGYFGGGQGYPAPNRSSIDRIDYSNDTATAPSKGPLEQANNNLSATGNSSYGYFGGVSSPQTKIDRVDYSNDTATATPKGTLSSSRYAVSATSSRENGTPTTATPSISPATRTEANSSPAGTNFGYTFGGLVGNYNTLSYTIQRIDFANDTATASVPSSMTNTSPSDAGNAGGFAVASLTHAYAGQSPNPSASSSIQRLDLSNDTTNASVHANMPETAFQTNGVGNSDYGYICGNDKTSTSRIDYSNDTATTSPKGDLTVERGSAGVTGTPSYGYVGSGWKSNFFTTTSKTDRIDYSNDTATAVVVGNMTFSKHNPTAAGNLSYGWFNQGGPGLNTRICRLDYSSDTTNAVQKGSLSASTYGRGATGDQSYGYFAGGFSPSPSSHETVVCRIDYANDTPTSSTKGPLTTGLFYSRMASSRANGLPFLAPKTVDKGADGFTTSTLGPAYGYIGGGFVSPHAGKTIVDRIDFGNDTATASPKGNLANAAAGRGATGSTAYGYWGGGSNPGSVTYIDRIDYASDTPTASPKGNLSQAKKNLAGVGNNSLGYMAGGQIGGYTATAVDRIDFANDTATAAPKGNLSGAIKWNSATGNQSYGYVGSGESPDVSTINRIDYASDTETTPTKGPLSYARMAGAATGNADYGYFGGGFPPSKTTVDRIDYSNDTATAAVKGPLSSSRGYLAATGDTSYGYFAGGWLYEPTANNYSTVDRVDYSSDTPTASPKGSLSRSDAKFAGASARANANASVSFIPRIRWVDSAAQVFPSTGGPAFGYFSAGGESTPGDRVSTVDRVDYSNDTTTMAVKGPISRNMRNHGAVGNLTHGYTFGGTNTTTVDRLDYAADTTTAVVKGSLTATSTYASSVGNGSYAYTKTGGNSNSTIERLDYSNDSAAASTKGSLASSAWDRAGTGNASYGYFGGAVGTNNSSKVERIDYADDTATALFKGLIHGTGEIKFGMAAAGNSSYGYWAGGHPKNSKISRLDYSNDTAATVVKGPMTRTAGGFNATGSPTFGYFAGDFNPESSSVDRVDYSNDTATASPKGTLTAARNYMGGNSGQMNGLAAGTPPEDVLLAPVQPPFPYPEQLTDPNFGYWIGGSGPSYSSTVDRVDWATDTGIAATKGPLSSDWMYMGAAVASPSYAYNGGGARSTGPSSSENYSTVIDRIDFTNDSATATPKGNLSGGKNRLAATGNASYGYFGGGFVQNPSVIDRVDYGNDTATATPKGPLNDNRWAPAATGNQSYGYFCGGMDTTNVDRVEYANDTPTASPKGKLSQKHNYAGATGNASYGYVGGGQSNDPAKYSSIDRIDFSNDTATSVLKGPLTAETEGVSATGNTSYGWWGGGQVPPGPNTSKLDRLDFSNDTATTSPRGVLSLQRNQASAASPTANANPN